MSALAPVRKYLASFWGVMLRGSRLPIYLGLLVTVLVFWIQSTDLRFVKSFMDRLDSVVYDQRFNTVGIALRNNEHNIVIVDYDESSLAREGQWPWSRFKLGDLVSQLASYGALVVGFDVIFPEYERNPINELSQRIEQGGANAEAEALLPQLAAVESLLDGDAYFADSMGNMDVVLASSFSRDGVISGVLPPPLFPVDADADAEIAMVNMLQMTGYKGNIDTLQDAATGGGFFNTEPDIDGVIRKYNLVHRYKDGIYPSLALDMARLAHLHDKFSAVVERGFAEGQLPTLIGISMDDVTIPTDVEGRVQIPYIGRQGSYPYIPAADVLRGTLTPEQVAQLENSIVLVGTTSAGLFDLRATPVQAVYPGVEVHANVLNALLSSSPEISIDATTASTGSVNKVLSVLDEAKRTPFPSRPDWEEGATLALIVLVGFGLSMIYPHLGPALLGVSSLSLMVGMVVLNFRMWKQFNLDFSLVSPLLLVLLIAIVNMTYGFLKEGLHRKVIKGMFDQYVPPAHIDAMLNNPDKYNFSGESKELSVLFSDIRNFTTISEKLKATELKAMLNEFFTPITGIIFDNNGTIDKYVGDMVMAFWGAPLDDPQHRDHAVNAALKMLAKVEELKPLFKQQGLPEVNIGIGINSGMMNVGDMGSTYRRAYTVIGDAVNLGSRLESITKTYGVKLLIGEQTYDGLTNILCRQVDKVQVKGKDEPIRIYQPLCRTDEASAELRAAVDEYHAAYKLYLQKQWDAAAAAFAELRRKDPDTYLYSLYLERIASLRTQELPADWDGTYRHTSK